MRPRRSQSWRPPTTFRTAVRRALDRVGGHHVDGDSLSRELRVELRLAGYRIRSTPTAESLNLGRPMTEAEARLVGLRP
jgi:hypothetical protein